MAHCPIEQLDDLRAVLDAVRAWPAIKEKSPAVFYFKSTPFLHFHVKDGRRWADVRAGKDWGPSIDIAFAAKKTVRDGFLKQVERCYALTSAPKRSATVRKTVGE